MSVIIDADDALSQALAERDVLQHEIHVKKSLLTPMIVRMQQEADAEATRTPVASLSPGPVVSPTETPMAWGFTKFFKRKSDPTRSPEKSSSSLIA